VLSSLLYRQADRSNYPQNKITENITAEIMMTCANETRESYDENIVVELKSDGSGGENEVEDNVHRIAQWAAQWTKDREAGVHEE
jgi:adenylate kinase